MNREPALWRIAQQRTDELPWTPLKLGEPGEFQDARVVLHSVEATTACTLDAGRSPGGTRSGDTADLSGASPWPRGPASLTALGRSPDRARSRASCTRTMNRAPLLAEV